MCFYAVKHAWNTTTCMSIQRNAPLYLVMAVSTVEKLFEDSLAQNANLTFTVFYNIELKWMRNGRGGVRALDNSLPLTGLHKNVVVSAPVTLSVSLLE